FETFSLCGRDRITAAQLIIILAGSDPNAPWLRDARLDLMTAWAGGAVQNLERDINDGIIRPLALAYKFGQRDRAGDTIDINDADAFVRRIGGSKYWTALWAERGRQTEDTRGDRSNPEKQVARTELGAFAEDHSIEDYPGVPVPPAASPGGVTPQEE